MDFREINLRVFEGRPLPHVFFQPRFEPWYAWHRHFDRMPARYAGMTLPQLYDDVDASMRTVHYYTDQPDPIEQRYDDQVKVDKRQTTTRIDIIMQTPYGELTEQYEKTPDHTWRQVKFPVQSREDLGKLRWIFQHTTY